MTGSHQLACTAAVFFWHGRKCIGKIAAAAAGEDRPGNVVKLFDALKKSLQADKRLRRNEAGLTSLGRSALMAVPLCRARLCEPPVHPRRVPDMWLTG
jgi:hypothetical protein